MRPAVFLDRDGTVIKHVHYIRDPADVRVLPGAAAGLRRIRELGYATVIITNQSAVGRGLMTAAQLDVVHAEMVRQLNLEGAVIDDWRFCSTVPAGGDRTVIEDPRRKPGPGMLLESARELSLDMSRSWMIGDMISDVLAGRNAGCRGCVMIRSAGNTAFDASHDAIDYVVRDLIEAATAISTQSVLQEFPAPPSGERD